jgi:hypothetical protein
MGKEKGTLAFGNSVTSEKLYLNFELTAESLLDKYYTISLRYQQAVDCAAIKRNGLKQCNWYKSILLTYDMRYEELYPECEYSTFKLFFIY